MKATSVEAYIERFSGEVRQRLEQMRRVIRETAPDAEEKISYGMPAYFDAGALVYFAAFAHHTGFYATPTGHEAFKEALSSYKQGKGSVQFPHDRPLPIELIEAIVRYRLSENRNRTKSNFRK
ncbi:MULTISPECIES: iron chaperone [unclassified Flavobacterium]|uniref:iron chaperone n=1 Tax=unclassified Flavobacterium TaxID=196869 RepID=UPI001F14676E|nr:MULTISPECIES: DUF1801 domain-containing protein [unclassified Flavobacterium]UMY67112.1 DUF1801 domain-containing protein [Flavobacterium sp. HJ-32-4]